MIFLIKPTWDVGLQALNLENLTPKIWEISFIFPGGTHLIVSAALMPEKAQLLLYNPDLVLRRC